MTPDPKMLERGEMPEGWMGAEERENARIAFRQLAEALRRTGHKEMDSVIVDNLLTHMQVGKLMCAHAAAADQVIAGLRAEVERLREGRE